MTIQSLKNIVINGFIVLGLSFGLMVSATADYSFEEIEAGAKRGDSIAQNILGFYYHEGKGVRQDYAKAFYWHQKSANQGDSDDQFYVGHYYISGEGVRQDYSKGLEWLKKSANQNNTSAQALIGLLYAYGKGVRQNKTTAKEWYGKACDNGDQNGCDDYKILNEQGY